MLDSDIVFLRPSEPFQLSLKHGDVTACSRIVLVAARKDADPPHFLGRLCETGPRQGHRRAAEQRDELPPSHSITSSARAISVAGTSRPSAFAVLRLITSSSAPQRMSILTLRSAIQPSCPSSCTNA